MNADRIRTMLPDYLAGRLTDDERRAVEKALSESDDLRCELDDIRTVFEALPVERIRALMQQRARYISVAVAEQVAAKRRSVRHWWRLGIAGAVAVAAFVAIAVQPKPPASQQLPIVVLDSLPELATSDTVTIVAEPLVGTYLAAQPPLPVHSSAPGDETNGDSNAYSFDAIATATFPYSQLDSQFVQHFVEVFSDASLE